MGRTVGPNGLQNHKWAYHVYNNNFVPPQVRKVNFLQTFSSPNEGKYCGIFLPTKLSKLMQKRMVTPNLMEIGQNVGPLDRR